MTKALHLVTILGAALLAGNEFAVGAFVHPALSRLDPATHVRSVQALGKVYGRVAPFWMAGVLALSALLVFLVGPQWTAGRWLALAASSLFLIVIIFSVLGPVPINNRVIGWDPDALPGDWQSQRRRWDRLHAARVVILVAALSCLVASALF